MFSRQSSHRHRSEKNNSKKFRLSIIIVIPVLAASVAAFLPSISHAAQLNQEIASSYNKADYETTAKLLEQEIKQLKEKSAGNVTVPFGEIFRTSLLLAHVYAWKLSKPERALTIYQDLIALRKSYGEGKELLPYELFLLAELYERKEAFSKAEACYKDFLQESSVMRKEAGDRELIIMNEDPIKFAKYQIDSIHLRHNTPPKYEPLLKELKLPALMIHYMAPFLAYALVPSIEYDAPTAIKTDLAGYIRQSPMNLSSMLLNYNLILHAASGSVDESSEKAMLAYFKKYSDSFFSLSLRYLLYKFYKESNQGKKAEQLTKELANIARKRMMKLIVEPDTRFASPETTWQTFKQALIEGDIDLVMECYVPTEQNMRQLYTALGKERMKDIGQKMRPIEKINADDRSAEYLITREENGKEFAYPVYFFNINGEWKIAKF